MPYNFFLHSKLVLTREVDNTNEKEVKTATKYFKIELVISLFFSFIISASIIGTFAHWSTYSHVYLSL